jgi:hypothetical protein
MALNPEVGAAYNLGSKFDADDQRPMIFPGLNGRRTLAQFTVADIQKLHAKGQAKDIFILKVPVINVPAPPPTIQEQLTKIAAATTAEEVTAIVGTDTRKTVTDAATTKIASFSK